MILNFIPFKCIGEFKISSRIHDYLQRYDFEYTEPDNITGWATYDLNELGLSLYVDKEKIISISCNKECVYREKNLISMGIDDFISWAELKIYGRIDELYLEEDDIPQYVYEFDDIGLQVWVKNKLIKTVIASGRDE